MTSNRKRSDNGEKNDKLISNNLNDPKTGRKLVNNDGNKNGTRPVDSCKDDTPKLSGGIFVDTRLMNASNIILGCPVILRVKSNETFHGIFVKYSAEFDVILECCHKLDSHSEITNGYSPQKQFELKNMLFKRDNIVEMTAYDVDKDFATKIPETNFIDAAIAKKCQNTTPRPRLLSDNLSPSSFKELEPFYFDDESLINGSLGSINDVESGGSSLDLDSSIGGESTGWGVEEMFLTNQTKYGYKSTYNSDLTEYTLPVEKENTDEYRKREEEAEKIAMEIESSTSYRKNIDKELSDGEEEEEAFSAVLRNAKNEINNNNRKYGKKQVSQRNVTNKHRPKLTHQRSNQEQWT